MIFDLNADIDQFFLRKKYIRKERKKSKQKKKEMLLSYAILNNLTFCVYFGPMPLGKV